MLRLMKKKNFVLDIDNTLVHTIVNTTVMREPDFTFVIDGNRYNVYKRPGVERFLENIFNIAKSVSVWSMGTKHYVLKVIKHVFSPEQQKKLKFIKTRQSGKTINTNHGVYSDVKLMSNLYNLKGFTRDNTVLIDDSDIHGKFSEGVIKVNPYFAVKKTDTHLNSLIKNLMSGSYNTKRSTNSISKTNKSKTNKSNTIKRNTNIRTV
jgi:hypothetical protein